MADLRCWQCGVEPTDTVDVRTMADPEPVLIPAGWPPGDHEHAAEPPTPGQLLAAGAAAFDRLMSTWR